jgi:modulator of FtsH protease HflK
MTLAHTHMLRHPEGDGGGLPPSGLPSGLPSGGMPPPSGRARSITLRDGQASEVQDTQAMLDPANQSLSDALNILLKLIYWGVIILAVVYLFSGLRRVQEGERGVRLLFGKVVDSNLEPGLRLSYPFPLGELVRVGQGVQNAEVRRDFWIFMAGGTVNESLDLQGSTPSIKPDQGGSGSIITGDGSVVHARWSAQYRRSRTAEFAQNMIPEQEEQMVLAAIKRGVVQAASEVPVDVMLRQSAGEQDVVAARARQVAQDTLDKVGSGIVLEALAMTEVTPPLWVRKEFQNVQATVAQSQQMVEQAQSQASGTLNGVAGESAGYFVDRIDKYEAALAQNDTAAADRLLAEISTAMQGQPVDFGGASRRASGDVTTIISDANAYRSQVSSAAQSAAARFTVLEEQFRKNPALMLQREWRGGVMAFTRRETVTQFLLPRGGQGDLVQVLLNQDPTVARDIERRINEMQAREAQEAQLRRQRTEGLKTETTTDLSGE